MTPEHRALLVTTEDRLRTILRDLEDLDLGTRLSGDLSLAYRVRMYVNAARRNLTSAVNELKGADHADH